MTVFRISYTNDLVLDLPNESFITPALIHRHLENGNLNTPVIKSIMPVDSNEIRGIEYCVYGGFKPEYFDADWAVRELPLHARPLVEHMLCDNTFHVGSHDERWRGIIQDILRYKVSMRHYANKPVFTNPFLNLEELTEVLRKDTSELINVLYLVHQKNEPLINSILSQIETSSRMFSADNMAMHILLQKVFNDTLNNFAVRTLHLSL